MKAKKNHSFNDARLPDGKFCFGPGKGAERFVFDIDSYVPVVRFGFTL